MARILSLDGGGSWALIQARALGDLYGNDTPGHQILTRFDLVAGTSGGSLVLAGLACNWTPSQVASKFLNRDDRRRLFSPLPMGWLNPTRLLGLGPKYSAVAKLRGLRELLGAHDLPLNEVPALIRAGVRKSPDFLIMGFDYDRRRAVFFRSSAASRAASASAHQNPTLAEAVHASTNAPVNFFDKPAVVGNRRMWDGAVGGYNNPVLAAVVEMLAVGTAPGDVRVLSIGTATDQRPVASNEVRPPMGVPEARPSTARDAARMATAILDDPPDAATFIAHVMLGQPVPNVGGSGARVDSTIVRMNPVMRPVRRTGRWEWPPGLPAAKWEKLINIDMDATADQDVALIDELAGAWIRGEAPNQAVRANSSFDVEIGHDTYPEAREAWRAAEG